MQDDQQIEYVEYKTQTKSDIHEAIKYNTNPNASWKAFRNLEQQWQHQ